MDALKYSRNNVPNIYFFTGILSPEIKKTKYKRDPQSY